MPTHFAYLARCNDDTLYAGYTTDIEKREAAHNQGKGAHYPRIRRPISIIYSEQFETRSEAQKREYQLKQLKKQDKELLAGANTL